MADLIGYLNGSSFDVDVSTASSEDGQCCIFGRTIPAIQETRTLPQTTIEAELLAVVLQETAAHLVLANFRLAMGNPVDTGFFCYRAIEGMMQSMRPDPKDKDDRAWEALRQALQIERSAIDAVQAHGKDARHGRISAITDADRAKVFRLTDQIVRRYLIYLQRGKTPLPKRIFDARNFLSETAQEVYGERRRRPTPLNDLQVLIACLGVTGAAAALTWLLLR